MQSREESGLVFIRLFPGEDIYQELTVACRKHEVKTAVVLCGIGMLKQFELGYFRKKGDYAPQEFQEPYELLSLAGNISKQGEEYSFHLHAALGSEDKAAVGGHLLRGTVEVTNEIVILKTNLEVKRILDDKTGLQAMFLGTDHNEK